MVTEPPANWDRHADVVVIGSGTGLAAALAASEEGMDVLVLEKAPEIGGTTAISGGGMWIPNCEPLIESIGETPRDELLEYLKRATQGRTPEEKLERYIDKAPEVHDFITDRTALSFHHVKGYSDYYLQFGVGGHELGHQISPDLYDGDRLGDRLDDVRDSPQLEVAAESGELQDPEKYGPVNIFPVRAAEEGFEEELERRHEENLIGQGRALVAGLYEALLNRGVEFEVEAPARELVTADGRVVGVIAAIDGEATAIEAGAVVIAAGGMEWDEEMRENFLAGPADYPASPPYNEGDGIVMGAEAGAKLGNMNQAWWFPVVKMDEEWPDGNQVYQIPLDRTLPGCIVVNEAGKRFANESLNYHDFGRAFNEIDPREHDYRNVPAYQVFDHSFRRKYPLGGTVLPDDDLPEWIEKADTLEALARTIGVDPEGLVETVERFNDHAREGKDPDFHRGEDPWDRHFGDPDAEHPNLAPLDEPPFYALEILPGCLGTKGGLVITEDAEVVDHDDEPIPGLYASANDTAHLMGPSYPGGGATIGPNVTFGVIAGENAAEYVERRTERPET